MLCVIPDHMIKEVRYYMEHDGLIEKRVVEKPPDSDDQEDSEVRYAQCGNFRIFLLLRFCVKSFFGFLEVHKMPFFSYFDGCKF